MALSRNTIYQALLDRLKTYMRDVETFSRKYMDYTQVQQMPAVLVIPTHQTPIARSGLPHSWQLAAMILIYVKVARTDDPAPDSLLLGLVDQVESALEYKQGEAPTLMGTDQFETTLGGAVLRTWISGTVEVYQGAEGEQAVALIPVEMLATA